MVLVDTSIWISHLREGDDHLAALLEKATVCSHPFVVGELACGNLKNRTEILSLLRALPSAEIVDHEEVLTLIDNNDLMGKGLGYVDVHLIGSALLSEAMLWTRDIRLERAAADLGVSYSDGML
jgi:predicted nucleic acid-binding protein